MERGPWLDASQEAGRVIDVDEWAEIRRLHRAEGIINPRFIGRRVDVRVTLTEVVATCAGIEVARHTRCLASHQTLTLPEHGQIARTMRVEAAVTDIFAAAVIEQRDLTVYDRAIGLR